jgi:hypothetical protein
MEPTFVILKRLDLVNFGWLEVVQNISRILAGHLASNLVAALAGLIRASSPVRLPRTTSSIAPFTAPAFRASYSAVG